MSTTDHEATRYEPGAPAVGESVALCEPAIRESDWDYVRECLYSGYVSSVGPFVSRLEEMLAARVGARHAVACVNGTAALHIALLVCGVEPDDEVVLPALTFIAPANAVRYVGAWPVFLDVEPDYWQLDPEKVGDFLRGECRWADGHLRNKTTDRRVRAIMPVHILGHPCDMDPIVEIARKYELLVIEDAAESLGARYKSRTVGHLGDIACFSFNGNKIVTAGGGGMIVTDEGAWADRARYLTTQAKDDPVEYVHGSMGYNYRLTNIQAALGCAQLERLDEHVKSKRRIAAAYGEALGDAPGLRLPMEAGWASCTFWLYTVLVDSERFGVDSRSLLRGLLEKSIATRPLWQPIHLSPAHAGSPSYGCKTAESLYRRALSLPSSVGLSELDQGRVISAIREMGSGAG